MQALQTVGVELTVMGEKELERESDEIHLHRRIGKGLPHYRHQLYSGPDTIGAHETIWYQLTVDDWVLIRPYLEQNESIFGIALDRLLTVNGPSRAPELVYRKIQPTGHKALMQLDPRTASLSLSDLPRPTSDS